MTTVLQIGGMTCANCQNRIEKKLKSTAGVEKVLVNYNTGAADITWNPQVVTLEEIKAVIESLDYKVICGAAKTPVAEIIGTLIIILALYMLLQGLGLGAITSAFTPAQEGMGYGMLFVIGLITSVHCAAMCGGINLSQCLPAAVRRPVSQTPAQNRFTILVPAIFYNAGRVISYTAAGIIVGALGSVIAISGRFQGIVQLIAGVFMVIMGINMLGLFQGAAGVLFRRLNLHIPKIFARKVYEKQSGSKSPLIIGLLNGLMPCGPLQAMQVYALSTGSPIAGGVSMFLFSIGTVPLMFGIGAASSLLSGANGRVFSKRFMKIGAILVVVMGMTMFTYGAGLSGFSFDFTGKSTSAAAQNGVQVINSTLTPGRYPAITVQQGIPVKWTINAPQGSINGCNNRMIIREYKIEHSFTPGENIIEFMPEKSGRFPYSCWMGMIRSSITVVAEGQSISDLPEPNLSPTPAGVVIPTDKAAFAQISAAPDGTQYQNITINLRDEGLEPALIVVQRGLPAQWVVNNNSLDPGNSRLIFPAYYTQIDIEQGDNVIQLMPVNDFDFSTGDNVFYGYVKVVDDINNVDIEAVKSEVENFETMIYPDAYF